MFPLPHPIIYYSFYHFPTLSEKRVANFPGSSCKQTGSNFTVFFQVNSMNLTVPTLQDGEIFFSNLPFLFSFDLILERKVYSVAFPVVLSRVYNLG